MRTFFPFPFFDSISKTVLAGVMTCVLFFSVGLCGQGTAMNHIGRAGTALYPSLYYPVEKQEIYCSFYEWGTDTHPVIKVMKGSEEISFQLKDSAGTRIVFPFRAPAQPGQYVNEYLFQREGVDSVEKLTMEYAVEKGTMIRFESTSLDAGKVLERNHPRYRFVYTNVGEEDLVLSTVKGTGGFFTADWSKDSLQPGGQDSIVVTFNTSGKIGPQNKPLVVCYNALDHKPIVLYYKAEVEREPIVYPAISDVYPKPDWPRVQSTYFREVNPGENQNLVFEIGKETSNGHVIEAVAKNGKNLPVTFGDSTHTRATVSFTAPDSLGNYSDEYQIRFRGIAEPKTEQIDYCVMELTLIEFDTLIIDLGKVAQGEMADFIYKFKNLGPGNCKIQMVRTSGHSSPIHSRDEIAPGDSDEIEIWFNTSHSGRSTHSATVIYNALNHKPIVLTYKCEVFPQPFQATDTPADSIPRVKH
jgi:hypothetical protein